MGAPSLDTCERDLVAQVRRDLGDADAHESLARWFRRTGRPIVLDPDLLQALARRWLAGGFTPGLTDLLLGDQALEAWRAPYDPAPFWTDFDRATLRSGHWVDQESGLPLRLRRRADGAPLALIPAGPEGPFYMAVRPFSFADLLRVGGAISAGVRPEDLALEEAPAYRVTESGQDRLLEACRGRAPKPREWWIAVIGVDPGDIGSGDPPDPESLAGKALATLTRGQGAVTTLERTPLGLEDVVLPVPSLGHSEVVVGLRWRLARRSREAQAPGDHRLQLRLRSVHRVTEILRVVHGLTDPDPPPRARRADPLRIDLRTRRRGLRGWFRDLIRPPPPRFPLALREPPGLPGRIADWTPPEPMIEEELPDRSDPALFAATCEAAGCARASASEDRAPEDLLVTVLRPLVAARRGAAATTKIPALAPEPALPEDPLTGPRRVMASLLLGSQGAPVHADTLASCALALAELRQPLAFLGITEVLLELAAELAPPDSPEHLHRLGLLRARGALQRGDAAQARAELEGPPPEDPAERFRWGLARARAHREEPEQAASLLPREVPEEHRAGELAFLRAAISVATGRTADAARAIPNLLALDLDRVPPGAGLPALDLGLLAVARTAAGDIPGAWAAALQARDLAAPWVSRSQRTTDLHRLTRLDGPPSEDPLVLRAQLAVLVDTITHPVSLRDLPGFVMLEATRRAEDLRWAASLPATEPPTTRCAPSHGPHLVISRRASSPRLYVLEDSWWAWMARVRELPGGDRLLGEALASRLPPDQGIGLLPRSADVPAFPDPRLDDLIGYLGWMYRDGDASDDYS